MKKSIHTPIFYFSFLLLMLHCGGTETGNPNVIVDSDFSKATTFLSNADADNYESFAKLSVPRKLMERLFGKSPLRIKTQLGSVNDFSKVPLLKLTENGDLEPAISMKYSENLPVAIQMNKIDTSYYVLFDRVVQEGQTLCTLMEFTLDGKITCIDSVDLPSEQRPTNARYAFGEDQKYFLVAKDGEHIIYRSLDGSLLFRETSTGQIKPFGPDAWTFEANFRGSDDSVFGANCRNYTSGSNHSLYISCKIARDQVTVYSADDVGNPSKKIFKLRGDQLLVVADVNTDVPSQTEYEDNLHMRMGPLGQQMNLTNYSTDFSAYGAFGSDTTDQNIRKYAVSVVQLPSILPSPQGSRIFFTSEWPNDGYQVCLSPLEVASSLGYALNCAGNPIAGGGSYTKFYAFDYIDAPRAVMAWGGANQACQIISHQLLGGPPGTPISPRYSVVLTCDEIDATPTMIRFISSDQFIFGGPKKGTESNPSKFYYYKYDFSDSSNKLLFESNRQMYVFPLE